MIFNCVEQWTKKILNLYYNYTIFKIEDDKNNKTKYVHYIDTEIFEVDKFVFSACISVRLLPAWQKHLHQGYTVGAYLFTQYTPYFLENRKLMRPCPREEWLSDDPGTGHQAYTLHWCLSGILGFIGPIVIAMGGWI